jgi:hypothetical protein
VAENPAITRVNKPIGHSLRRGEGLDGRGEITGYEGDALRWPRNRDANRTDNSKIIFIFIIIF